MSAATAQSLFWAFCALMGLSLASIFLVFTGTSIARTFFITAAMFGATSLYGYTTRRDLTSMGSFLIMGLIGVIIAMLANLFIQSTALQFAISVIGVLVFTGLTAYDTQNIKQQYAEGHAAEAQSKLAVLGALSLYLNFINIFQLLLGLTGEREQSAPSVYGAEGAMGRFYPRETAPRFRRQAGQSIKQPQSSSNEERLHDE